MGFGSSVAVDADLINAIQMEPELWKRIKEAFNAANELTGADRAEFILKIDQSIRANVLEMLDAAEADSRALNEPLADVHSFEMPMPSAIGDYRIIKEIGRGGMGVVYQAVRETEDFTKRVAIKVIRSGFGSDLILKRFRSEQQILSGLEHENIARFVDGGRTPEGLPYYAMEFVEGIPIVEFCRDLDAAEIVGLFRRVCAAVSSAHAQLIVHRDLKPSNILVTAEGVPKLLDFGIAKALDRDSGGETATQLGMMTPQYASPEQIRGERVSTSSDVYSLGIILYELLSGRRPYDFAGRSYAEILETISNAETTVPSLAYSSKLRTGGDSDLDNIVLKALQRDPGRRYSSVDQFSEDLRRYLLGLPVLVRPDSLTYRFRRFVGRNRAAAVATVIVTLTLIAGIAATSWQAYRAERQRELAEKRFREVRAIANNVVFKYHDEIQKLNGSTAIREMLISDATRYLDGLAADSGEDPELQRELGLAYLKLGDAQGAIYSANTGNTGGALESYGKAIDLLESVARAAPDEIQVKDELIKAYDRRLSISPRVADSAEFKLSLIDRSVELIESIIRSEPRSALRISQLATIFIRKGDSVGGIGNRESLLQKLESHARAAQLAEESAQLAPDEIEIIRVAGRSNQRVGTTYVWLGENALINGSAEDAAGYFRSALPHHERMFRLMERLAVLDPSAETRRNLIAAQSSFAKTLSRNGRTAEALELARSAALLAAGNLESDSGNREARFDSAEIDSLFGLILENSGDSAAAIPYFEKSRASFFAMFKADGKNLEAINQVVDLSRKLAKLNDAIGNRASADENRRQAAGYGEMLKNAKAAAR